MLHIFYIKHEMKIKIERENMLLTLFTLGKRIVYPLSVDKRPVFDDVTKKKIIIITICE